MPLHFLATGGSAPGLSEILTHFAFDVPWIAALIAAGAWYIWALRRLERTGPRVPFQRWRAVLFIAGLLWIAVGVLSPLEYYGNQVLWIDFLGFLVITMIAPPLILLGAPLTLAFRVSGPVGRARLRRLYRSRFSAVVTFPVFSWLLFAVATYLWQFSSLTDWAAQNAYLRDFQQVSLIAVALIFWIPALCTDPVRWRMAYPLRGLYVFVEMTHKALFGAMFLALNQPIHHYFRDNVPAWGPSPMLDQRMAILVLWIGGNIIFLGVLVGIITRWVQYEARNSARIDLRLEREHEAEQRRRAALDKVFRRPI